MPKNKTIDLSGKVCPIPALKTRRELQKTKKGDVLTVISTDPNTKTDLPYFCAESGNKIVNFSEKNNIYTFKIKKC